MAFSHRILSRIDVHALGRALQAYRRMSVLHDAEVRDMLRNDGWRATAMYCARRCQHIALGLKEGELAPCELREQTIGGIRQVWMADPRGIDQRRAEMAMLLRRLLHLGLSRYEPHPTKAIEAAEARRRELRVATEPTGDAA